MSMSPGERRLFRRAVEYLGANRTVPRPDSYSVQLLAWMFDVEEEYVCNAVAGFISVTN